MSAGNSFTSNAMSFAIVVVIFLFHPVVYGQSSVGAFSNHTDVGNIVQPGSAIYNESNQEYELSGAGSNIWFKKDEFHYAYKKIKGNFILQARGYLVGKGVEEHRKFGWMIRSS